MSHVYPELRTWTPREHAIYTTAKLESEEAIATLTAERDQWKSMLESERDEQGRAWGKDVAMTELWAERDALRTALEAYGRHKSGCDKALAVYQPCSCGWEKAREALGGKS